ncbi:hypothetical protein [Mesobacillus selenatarsenatis]|uniref:Uncharacterized protein n=1 Tax=Mesobacillus selenatarsenatis (strain DSM 18680 / JCM 14380 / FERM P-15431 / SF-1) TaxID=1321606 RepID=A0A0A8X2V3_MESS1|nr:hypothetical protein [Mesobacillus selenatarsenatis]GAM12426.1 hypothetical protein SAMD00020551_0560 [Mesobacillus selenatarsenatis SF-1]
MKRLIVTMLVFIIVGIGSFWTFDYVSRDGDFTKWSHTTMGYEHYKEGKKYYLGYDINWEGIGKPTLEKVEFIKKDGTIVAKDDDEFKNEPYIAKNRNISGLDEESVLEEGKHEDLTDIKNYQVDEDFHLILAAQYIQRHDS